MTKLQSGYFESGNNTPNNAKLQIPVDNPYMTKDSFILTPEAQGLGITASSDLYTSGQLDTLIQSASAWINRYCGRYFDVQTVDEQKTGFTVKPFNPRLVTVTLQNKPYRKINSIYLQVLRWFIQIDASATTGYIQDFPRQGYYKIVPMLSSAGMGVPLPAQIIDKIPLGVLWTNYTFGYGADLTGEVLSLIGVNQYQAELGNRLWASSQPLNIYVGGVLQSSSVYTVDYVNGIITFSPAIPSASIVTADFTTSETVPSDIKQACILIVTDTIAQGKENPGGADSYGIQTYNISFGPESKNFKRVEQFLGVYQHQPFKII